MNDILGIATRLSAGKHHSIRNDDVFIDRLNHRYTVTMILVFAGIVTTQQYFGSPITCWVKHSTRLLLSPSLSLSLRSPLNSPADTRNTPMTSVGS